MTAPHKLTRDQLITIAAKRREQHRPVSDIQYRLEAATTKQLQKETGYRPRRRRK